MEEYEKIISCFSEVDDREISLVSQGIDEEKVSTNVFVMSLAIKLSLHFIPG
jgi:hypothetical protein